MRNVEARTGEFRELNVASDAYGFRSGGHAAQAEASGSDAFAHDRARGKRNVFRMFDDRKIERAAIFHHLTGEPGGGDGFSVVADSHDAGFFHCGDFRDSFAFAADTRGADGPDANSAGGGFGAIENETRDAGVVVDGLGVGHAANGGESAASGTARAGFDGFGRFLAGFA